MTYQAFKELIDKNSMIYIMLFILLAVVYFRLFKKEIMLVFDPLLLYLVPSLAAGSFVIIVLEINGLINVWLFINLLLYQILFILGTKLIRTRKIVEPLRNDRNMFKIFYTIHTALFVITITLFFKNFGISLIFNKFLIYNSGALLNYATICLFPGQVILIIIKRSLFHMKKKRDFFLLFLLTCAFLVKGGKGDFVNFVSYIFVTIFIVNKNGIKSEKLKRKLKNIQIILAGISLGIVMFFFSIITQARSIFDILYQIYFRLLNYGDIYYTGFVDGVIDRIPRTEFYQYYLWAFISPFRTIFNIKEPLIAGNEILKELYGYTFQMGGPNFRFDVALIYYFPLLIGMILAPVLGIIFSYFRSIRIFDNFLDIYLQAFFAFSSILITIDFGLFVSNVAAIIVFLPIILSLSLIVKSSIYSSKFNMSPL